VVLGKYRFPPEGRVDEKHPYKAFNFREEKKLTPQNDTKK